MEVIDARNLPKSTKGTKGKSDIVDPYVVISVQGAKVDTSEQVRASSWGVCLCLCVS